MEIPAKLTTYAPNRWGLAAAQWLQSLPETVDSLTRDWNLEDLRPTADANRSFVAAARAHGQDVYLKVEFDPQWAAAADTLAAWSGEGVTPRVLARCDKRQATLITDAGGPATLDPLALSARVGEMLQVVHSMAPVPSVAGRHDDRDEWARVAQRRFDSLGRSPFDRALLARQLPPPHQPPAWVHGDLTARNVRQRADGLQLIDPDPAVGPAELDTVQWALRVEDGRRWRQHLERVTGGTYDPELAAALIPHMCRTHVVYRLSVGRAASREHQRLAQLETVAL